jgi:hypothetical protein
METITLKFVPELEKFITELKADGFIVLAYETDRAEKIDLTFFKNGRFGYVSRDYFYGWHFSTCNKPSHWQGTGYAIGKEREEELTLTLANKCVNAPLLCPWVKKNRQQRGTPESVKTWLTVEEFLSSETILKYHII